MKILLVKTCTCARLKMYMVRWAGSGVRFQTLTQLLSQAFPRASWGIQGYEETLLWPKFKSSLSYPLQGPILVSIGQFKGCKGQEVKGRSSGGA